ncbi:FapA family protein [Bacillus sp. FJAT-45350]|uniref:FapA family protein n=1 Tax=Bacillus sp. FJAT-45350 TaxID=2011014 RepID=UPI000BB993AA|nr:FapA family protein [Bacillus sp. FJAT-45350]
MKNDAKLFELIDDLNLNQEIHKPSSDNETQHTSRESVLNKNDGFIEVRDQQLFVIDPNEGGKNPILVPNTDLQILVNEQLLKKERIVFSKDKIEIHRKSSSLPFTIKISDDKLSILLQVSSELFKTYELATKARSHRMMLELEAVSSPCDVEEVSSKITEEVLKKGVSVEIYTTKIIQELLNPTFKPIKVAEGLPPIPAVDSVIEKYFSKDLKEVIEEVDGKADYKNRLKIPTVEAGQVIARLFPPKEGKDGINVYGEVLQPKPPKKIEVRPKPRVRLTEDGQVIALQQGRPSITGHSVKHIDILETYEVNSDVDMKTGNIYFSGDVLIRGHVKDNMKVESSGSIYVYGNVYHAKLAATQDIHIMGTVINSKVIAGQLSMYYSQVYKTSQDLLISFEKLILAVKQLEKSMTEKNLEFNFNHVIQTLFEMKFDHIIKEVNQLYQIFSEMPENQIQHSVKTRILLNGLSKFKDFHSIRMIQSIAALNSILLSIKELIIEMESMVNEESSIQIKSATSSTIKTNGEIIIKKDGVIQSQLFAGKNIIFSHKDAVIRGGKIEALQSIKASTVGTELGEPPELYAGEMIEIDTLYQSKIKLPYYNEFFEGSYKNLKFIYDPKTEKVKRM